MRQSWLTGAVAAIEACVGGVLALMAIVGTFATTSILVEKSPSHHHGRLSAMQGLVTSLGIGLLSLGFLWAGLSLMFGWQTTWRSQLVPVASLILIASYVAFASLR